MNPWRYTAIVALLIVTAFAQSKIVIPAGTPEDRALTEISKERDQQKRVAMLEGFVKQYSANPAAVAYGNWQLSQQFATTDPARAMGYGDLALAAMPDALDILQTQADLAQQTRNYEKVVDYATRAAVVIHDIDKKTKPDGASDEEFNTKIAAEKAAAAPVYEYMATAAYNAMAAEPDKQKRLSEIERFNEIFRDSDLADNANLLAVLTFQEMSDMPKLIAYGEKSLAGNPKDATMLILLANTFAEDAAGTNLPKADAYSRRAIELIKADNSTPEAGRKIAEGFARQILGYTLLREDKTTAAIGELKLASAMLKNDPAKYSVALYRLGVAYAKDKQTANAKQVLDEATIVDGPFKDASRQLLEKVNKMRPGKK